MALAGAAAGAGAGVVGAAGATGAGVSAIQTSEHLEVLSDPESENSMTYPSLLMLSLPLLRFFQKLIIT